LQLDIALSGLGLVKKKALKHKARAFLIRPNGHYIIFCRAASVAIAFTAGTASLSRL
jgi:hypothetical protein